MMNRRHTPSTLFVSSVSVGLKPHTGCSNITPFFRRNYSIPRPRTIPTSLTIRASSTTTANKIRIAVLVSGGGRSLKNLHERIQSRSLRNVEICTVLSSKSTAGAIDLANSFNLPVHVISSQDYKGKTAEYSDAITKVLDSYSPDLVVMAGWITFYQIPSHYASKVINIHPALTPSFSGKGYYGDRVHRAVLEFGAKVSGCTVHFADNEYDHGPIILQKAVPVYDSDSVDDLAARVFEAEKDALPEALQLFADSRLQLNGRIVKVLAAAEEHTTTSR